MLQKLKPLGQSGLKIPHAFYKPIACLIFKIFIIWSRNQICVFLTVFITLPTTGENEYGKNRSLKDF